MPTHALPKNSPAHPHAWIIIELKVTGEGWNLMSLKLKKMNPLILLSAAKLLALHSNPVIRLKSSVSTNFEIELIWESED